ncbi:putative fbxl4 [Operophtera brumata]|uniref:Putative fbxl4 n=1 Tax=Operophtera brumata TaxID=104452 RepID=A0A0L7LQC6_OPEBR|nr:putative fbxl4 [Operophtera brumata]
MHSASDAISSLFWFKEPAEQKEDEELVLEQFVQSVDDFSSQYGSEISVSYTAFNLRGPPSNFPDYGDYPQAFVMRTYGTWWDEAPSATEDYMPQNNNNSIPSQDFVEVSFSKEVYPLEVSIFETYNPGALVRIWARGPASWMLLWEGEPEYVVERPRIFTPPIRQINVPTRILRLEFNHKLLPYYTELDAVLLKGRFPPNVIREKNNFTYSSLFVDTEILKVIVDFCPHLEGSCKMIATMDDVAIALGTHCPNLKSVDFWKSYSLTPSGIRALGRCESLQELDVGWCLQAGGSGEWLQWIAGSELRKLFLGALRGVCDRDLRALVSRAPRLTQLDLLGVRAVTPDICAA